MIGFRIAPCYVTRSDDLHGQIDLTVKAAPFAKGDQVNEGAVIVSFEEE